MEEAQEEEVVMIPSLHVYVFSFFVIVEIVAGFVAKALRGERRKGEERGLERGRGTRREKRELVSALLFFFFFLLGLALFFPSFFPILSTRRTLAFKTPLSRARRLVLSRPLSLRDR